MTPDHKEIVFKVSVWSDALRALNRFSRMFIDEFGGWASQENILARDAVLSLLDEVEQILTKQYRDALTEQVNAWDKANEIAHDRQEQSKAIDQQHKEISNEGTTD